MSRIVNIIKTLRNHWKKSTFAFGAVSYGVNYGVEKMRTDDMMRVYCEEALKFGQVPIPLEEKNRHITVILNPAAKKKKAKAKFEKYCAPLLHLAGLSVSVVQTEAEGQARGLMEVMSNTDAVVIAGGDGTLSEAVTGLLRRQDAVQAVQKYPMAVLPLGRTNAMAASVFGRETNEARHLAEATMALIRGFKKKVDVMKIEATEGETKPVYAVSELQWGAYRDTHVRRDKYWMWGPWRSKAASLFCWPKSELTWNCEAELTYLAPCSGCQKCLGVHLSSDEIDESQQTHKKRWWQAFVPKPSPGAVRQTAVNYKNVINPDCGVQHTRSVSTINLRVATANAMPAQQDAGTPSLTVSLDPTVDAVGMLDFVRESWRREDSEEAKYSHGLHARELWLTPQLKNTEEEQWISIDQENFELKPMHIILLPLRLHLFCPST